MAKKTGKANLGPEMAKKAYEAKLSERVPYSPDWDGKPMRQKETWDSTKVKKLNPKGKTMGQISKEVSSNPVPGKTRIGNLAGGGIGGMFGIKNR